MSANYSNLEWDFLIHKIKSFCSSKKAKLILDGYIFADSFSECQYFLDQVSEVVDIFEKGKKLPLNKISYLVDHLTALKKGGVVSSDAIVDIASTLTASRLLKKFIMEHQTPENILYSMIFPLYTNEDFEIAVDRTFSNDGTVLDNASPQLAIIRNSLRTFRSEIKVKLNSIVQAPQNKNIVQEKIVTQRNDRYVIPVKVEHQNHIKGIVQDQSVSGSTVYIEPLAIVEENNKIARKLADEKREIERIIQALCERIYPDIDKISDLETSLSEIDVISAKALFSININGKKQLINDEGIVELRLIRHPVLIFQSGFDKVVPIDISIGSNYNALIITGSNTGGKTVSLKTIGLACLLTRLGIFLPTEKESKVSFFKEVLADIGDEQDIQQNLSTFSSHLTNIKYILENSSAKSLVLLDEIGTGTDPQEGVALSKAILDDLLEKGSKIVITTHYNELKTLAYTNEKISNASVEFDNNTLSPTYKLLVGIAGKSNALHIAKKIGIPETVLIKARENINYENEDISQYIRNIENKYKEVISEKDEAEVLKVSLAKKEAELNQKLKIVEQKQEKLNEKLHDSFETEINKSLSKVKKIVKGLQKDATSVNAEKSRQKLNEIYESVKDQYKVEHTKKLVNNLDIKVGESYFLQKIGKPVEVLGKGKSGKYEVVTGNIKLMIDGSELLPTKKDDIIRNHSITVDLNKNKPKPQSSSPSRMNECDLRGMRAHQAISLVEEFLDSAYLENISKSYIIHGRGTGALKKAVREYLDTSSYPLKYESGSRFEGGEGVTVVTLSV